MTTSRRRTLASTFPAVWTGAALMAMAACGGSYELPPTTTDTTTNDAALPPTNQTATLSADQQIFEKATLSANGGYYSLDWYMPWDPKYIDPEKSYLIGYRYSVGSSPLSGIQAMEVSAPQSIARSASLAPKAPTTTSTRGEWILQGGEFVSGATVLWWVRYLNDAVLYEGYRPNGVKPLWSRRVAFSELPLQGRWSDAPESFSKSLDMLFYQSLYVDTSQSFAANAVAYQVRSTTAQNATFTYDCAKADGGASPSAPVPCTQGTSLQAALSAGLKDSKGVIHYWANGDSTTIEGLNAWICKTPVDNSQNPYKWYRTFVEKDGAIYVGYTERSGTPAPDSYSTYRPGPDAPESSIEYLDYAIRLNPAAFQSLKDAMRL